MLEDIIEKNSHRQKKPVLFLHSCCAPCSSYVLEYLNRYFHIIIFYYNPNISPREEFEKRTNELRRLIEEMPMQEVLRYYYRQAERDCDMIFMASNFDVVFDPSVNFRPDSKDVNHYNTTAIQDPTLYALALDMRQTAPGDALKYVQKWVAFQKEFQEEVPMIPLYSNVYFDFYPRVLQNYNVSSNVSWGKAIVDAYMSDVH